jgi:hypothetical protein
VWLHNAAAQSKAGLEQYCYMDNTSVTINPKAWYQFNKGWYVEGRYNYESAKTFSLLAGKTFEYKSTVAYAITPMAGFVTGKLNGVALAANTSVEYRKISFSLQSQYTFSIEDRACNFMYNWADLSYELSHFLSAGMSLQQTNLYRIKGTSDIGFFLKAAFGKWDLPVYIFNPTGDQRYMVLGLNIALQ